MAGSEGEGGLMKGRVPQGDTHSATQLPLLLSEAAAPSAFRWYLELYWDSESQRQISANPTQGRTRRALTPQPDEFDRKSRKKYSRKKKSNTNGVSFGESVERRAQFRRHLFLWEKTSRLRYLPPEKSCNLHFFPFSRLIRVAPVSDRRPGTLVSWLNTAKVGGGSPCRGLQSSNGFCETETIMSAITFYRENPPNGLMPIKSLFFPLEWPLSNLTFQLFSSFSSWFRHPAGPGAPAQGEERVGNGPPIQGPTNKDSLFFTITH